MAKYDREEVLKFHQGGKVAVRLPKPLKTKDDLCLAYTPGDAHDTDEKIAKMSCLPEKLEGRRYYTPSGLGREANMKARLQAVRDYREGRSDVPPFSTPPYAR